jgi:hypothetical protein
VSTFFVEHNRTLVIIIVLLFRPDRAHSCQLFASLFAANVFKQVVQVFKACAADARSCSAAVRVLASRAILFINPLWAWTWANFSFAYLPVGYVVAGV